MNSSDNIPVDLFDQEQSPAQRTSFDFKRVFFKILRFWYIVLGFLAIALIVTFFKNRYATRVYPVSASILIKESAEQAEGRLLYNNPLVSGYRNYLNELYILKSYPLMQSTIEDLNFGVSFYQEGNFVTSEVYQTLPIEAFVVNDHGIKSRGMIFRILDRNRYKLAINPDEPDANASTFNFNDTIQFNDLDIVFRIKEGIGLNRSKGIDYIFKYTAPSVLTGSYVNKLDASWAELGSGVINLSISGATPNKEIDFLSGLIDNYRQYDEDKKKLSASNAIQFITAQLAGISDSLNRVELQVERFKDRNVVTDLSRETLRLYDKLEDMEMEKSKLDVQRNYYEYVRDYIQKGRNNLDQVILPSSIGINDGVLTSLISKMIDLQMEIKMTSKDNKLETPLTMANRKRMEEVRNDILESISNQSSTDQIQRNFYNKQISAIEQQLNYLPVAERQYVSIKRQYSLLENLYVFLLQKKAEADISKAATTSDIEVVNPPMRAGGAITPKIVLNYAIAVAAGLVIPFLLFVLQEFFNNRVQSREDIEKITKIPFIGGIGHKKVQDNLVVGNFPKSSVAESFRAMRSNLNYFTHNREKSIFIITSSISGEGKSFTTINLGSVFALSGKKTLIVGADLRKPKIYGDFNLANNVGLSSYLAGFNSFDQVVQPTNMVNLDLVSGGPVPPNPSELLLSAKMDQFIQEAQKQYNYILVDTPPQAIVTDAFVLSKYADHIVFVVRQNYTPKEMLRTIDEYYASGRLKNISIVLNDIQRSGPGYGYGYGSGYGYGYSYGYGYGHGYYDEEKNGDGTT